MVGTDLSTGAPEHQLRGSGVWIRPRSPTRDSLAAFTLVLVAANRVTLSGDFDVQVGFTGYNGQVGNDVTTPEVRIGLMVSDANPNFISPQDFAFISIGTVATAAGTNDAWTPQESIYRGEIAVYDGSVDKVTTAVTQDTSGTLRITRVGSAISLYCQGSDTPFMQYDNFVETTMTVALYYWNSDAFGAIRFQNLVLNSGSNQYALSGTYQSAAYGAGRTSGLSWDSIAWQSLTPLGTQVLFQVASSTVPGRWVYAGPDGTSETYYAENPSTLVDVAANEYISYQATLIGNGSTTPTLYRTDILFGGTSASALTVYEYDVPDSVFDCAHFDQSQIGAAEFVDCFDNLNGTNADFTYCFDQAYWDETYFDSPNGEFDYADFGQQANGNLSRIQTESTAGNSADARDLTSFGTPGRINDLNQITRQDVVAAGASTFTSYLYTYDLSGNMTSKTQGWPVTGSLTNGSDNITDVSAADIATLTVGDPVFHELLPGGTTVATISGTSFTVTNTATGDAPYTSIVATQATGAVTTYSWDEDNRLIQVDLPSGVTITYTYDVAGRLLTKNHSVNGQTSYEWDGFDCVREFAPGPTGTATFDSATFDSGDEYGWDGITNYYVVNGVLWGVDFGGGTCAVVADAQGHIRALVDPNSNTVFSASYNDPWGANPVVTDDTPGMYFRYVGQWGVRTDPDTGLVYMRQRWYDYSQQRRFINRDTICSINRYSYASNSPSTFIDRTGSITVAPALSAQTQQWLEANKPEYVNRWGKLAGEAFWINCKWMAVFALNDVVKRYSQPRTGANPKVSTADVIIIANDLKAVLLDPNFVLGYNPDEQQADADSFRINIGHPTEGQAFTGFSTALGTPFFNRNRNASCASTDEDCTSLLLHEAFHIYRGRLLNDSEKTRYLPGPGNNENDENAIYWFLHNVMGRNVQNQAGYPVQPRGR